MCKSGCRLGVNVKTYNKICFGNIAHNINTDNDNLLNVFRIYDIYFFTAEPLSCLRKLAAFSVNPKHAIYFKFMYTFCFIIWNTITYLTFKYTSEETFLKRVAIMVPLLFTQPVSVKVISCFSWYFVTANDKISQF